MLAVDFHGGSHNAVRRARKAALPDFAAAIPMSSHIGGAYGGDRLRSRIQQPRAGAGACGNLRALDAGGRGLSRRGDEGTARRARARLRIDARASSSTCSRPARPPRRRSRCSSTAATGARSTPRCSATWRAASMRTASTVAVAGYDLCPQVAIADIIEETRHALLFLWQRIGQRLMVYGHSAGGHLAAAMLATDWHGLYPEDAGRPGARRLRDLRRVRSLSARRRRHEPGSAARRRRARAGLAAVLAGAQGPRLRRRGRRPRIERVPAPEPDHRGRLGQGRRRHPLSRSPAPTISPCSTR